MQKQGQKKKFTFGRKQTDSHQQNPQISAGAVPKVQKMNIFHMTQLIDSNIEKHLMKKAYILIGKSRSGKSTAMNWINRISLKGSLSSGKVVYQVDTPSDSSKIGHGFESCTIVPNILKMGDHSIIDTAGFGDTCNYVRMIGVSYGLQALFDHLQSAKFILVITRSDLNSSDGKALFECLNYFLDMFRLKYLSQGQRAMIYQAVTILVTCSQPKQDHLSTLLAIGEQLANKQLGQIRNVDYMIQLLEELINGNRICEFNQAVEYCAPQECNIIDQMETKDWKYFTFNEEKRVRFIHLPIDEDFKRLPQKDKIDFAENIKTKIESFKQFSKSINNFIIEEMTVSREPKDQDKKEQLFYIWSKFKQPYERFYNYVETFLKKHDHYKSEELIDPKELLKDVFPLLENDRLLEQMIKMKRSFEGVIEQDNESSGYKIFDQIKGALQTYLQSLIKIFARNKAQYKKLLQLKFILIRSVRQLLMLSKVSRNSGINSIQGIRNSTFQTIRSEFISIDDSTKMLKDFVIEWFKQNQYERITLLTKNKQNPVSRYIQSRLQAFNIQYILIENRKRLDKYLGPSAFKPYEKIEFQICYYRVLRDIKLIYAKYQYDEGKTQKALMNLIAAFRIDNIYQYFRQKELDDEQDKQKLQAQIQQISLNQENILNDIIMLLMKMKKLNLSAEIALFLDKKDTVCTIYEMQISKGNQEGKINFQKMSEYGEYCFKNLRSETGTIIYQKMIQSQLSSIKTRKRYQKDLLCHINNKDTYIEVYRNNFEMGRQKNYNQRLNQIINNIQIAVALDARHRQRMINYSKNTFIENLSENKFNIKESANNYGDSLYIDELTYEDKQLGVKASSYKNISNYQHEQKSDETKLQINVYNPEDISDFTFNFINLFKQYPKNEKLSIMIDIQQMEIHHYLITQKYVVIKFTKEMVDNSSNRIKLIKFIRSIIYENGENIKQAANEIYYCFEKQAIHKMRELCLRYEGKITDVDLIRILKESANNLTDSTVVNNYNKIYSVLSIPMEIVEKVVQSWRKFYVGFDQKCDQVILMSHQRKNDSDNLIFCDF